MTKEKRSIAFYLDCWGVGGIESFVISTARQLVRDGWKVSVFASYVSATELVDLLLSAGATLKVAFGTNAPGLVGRTLRTPAKWKRFLREEKPDVVHINTMNGVGFVYSWIAQRAGVPVRVIHSHNSDVGEGARELKRILGRIGRSFFGMSPTSRIACSEEAGRYLFGTKDFIVIPNGIDAERFKFEASRRDRTRKELGVNDNELLFGNTSRLSPAKNVLFQLEVFAQVIRTEPSAHYLMMGQGQLIERARAKAKELGVEERVIWFNPRPDPESLYCALDAMLFPSYFEGLPMALLEAQCSGLPLLCSDAVSGAAKVTDLVWFKSLKDSPQEWGKQLLLLARDRKCDRASYFRAMKRTSVDCARKLEGVYGCI